MPNPSRASTEAAVFSSFGGLPTSRQLGPRRYPPPDGQRSHSGDRTSCAVRTRLRSIQLRIVPHAMMTDASTSKKQQTGEPSVRTCSRFDSLTHLSRLLGSRCRRRVGLIAVTCRGSGWI